MRDAVTAAASDDPSAAAVVTTAPSECVAAGSVAAECVAATLLEPPALTNGEAVCRRNELSTLSCTSNMSATWSLTYFSFFSRSTRIEQNDWTTLIGER